MNTLMIKDLPDAVELHREDMRVMRGGMMPGGCVQPLPTDWSKYLEYLPQMPQMPEWPPRQPQGEGPFPVEPGDRPA